MRYWLISGKNGKIIKSMTGNKPPLLLSYLVLVSIMATGGCLINNPDVKLVLFCTSLGTLITGVVHSLLTKQEKYADDD